jgi:hypothetical protein
MDTDKTNSILLLAIGVYRRLNQLLGFAGGFGGLPVRFLRLFESKPGVVERLF